MDNAVQIIASPNKTNIRLGLCKVPTHHMNCLDWIVQHAKDEGSAMLPILIYCQSLKSVGRVFAYLKAELQGHAWVGCDPDCRSENLLIGMFHSKTLPQNKQRVLASLRGEGNCRIVVSTTALGMGLHFANVSHVVMYGAPGDLEAILQQAGRAGRHGQPSHAILYNTGQYFKVDEEVKKLLAVGKTTCFRKSLHAHFEAEPSHVEPGHLCCTYCQTVCACSSGTCTEPMPNYEQIEAEPTHQRSRHVDANDKSLIADLLNDYRDSLINSSNPLYTSHAACTGFSQQLVDAVLTHCQYIFDLAYISANLPVFRLDHAKEILIIISDVFGDIDGDLQYDSERYLTDPDLYFSNYFDNVDDDVEDTLTSHVSSSESEQ
ncbi:putative ATP-dependent DNA helicase Q1 isoform X2 [Gadus chalcogrammus]|nr:putative ATP-dependent DNA helicase Q1 isoform X2 [Gadus chalcogrammus]